MIGLVAISTAKRLVTPNGRIIVTELDTVDEVVEMWRTKYDAIFGAESRARRLWATTARAGKAQPLGAVEAKIEERQKEWDEYVREQLEDIAQGAFL